VSSDRDRSLGLLLFQQDNVLTRQQALRFFSPKALRHHVESGRWQRPHLGVYVAHNGPITTAQARWVAVLACRAYIAGVSALALCGLRGFDTPRLHLLIPAYRRDLDPPPHALIHRTSALPHSERGMVDGLPCTVPARAAVDAAQWSSTDEQAARIVAACVQQRLVTAVDVRVTLDRMSRARRRSLIGALLDDLAGGAGSLPEAHFLAICRRAGANNVEILEAGGPSRGHQPPRSRRVYPRRRSSQGELKTALGSALVRSASQSGHLG
jgi:hypothetical protein